MDSLNEFSDSLRGPEFQVVFIIDYDDGRMFPLTEDCPKCLLPVGNRKLLSYQLDMLAMSGIAEVYIVAPREYEAKLSHFLGEYIRDSMNIDFVPVDDMGGSADCLRAVADRIRGDFFCLHSDFISQYCLGELASMHRLSSSDVTMLFSTAGKDTKSDEVDEEFIGICDNGRVVMKVPMLEIDESLELSKPLLHHASTLALRKDLLDLGVYLMSYWIIEFCLENKRISGIRTDLLPYLINRQFQPTEYLVKLMPALEHRHRPLKAIEPWITSGTNELSCQEDCVAHALLEHINFTQTSPDLKPPTPLVSSSALDMAGTGSVPANTTSSLAATSTNTTGLDTSSTTATTATANALINHLHHFGDTPPPVDRSKSLQDPALCGNPDALRCFALVYDPTGAELPSAAAAATTTTTASAPLLGRVTNLTTYLSLNKDIVLHKHTAKTPWPKFQNFMKKEMSVLGDGCEIAEKTVTIKQCCIGNNCKIGQMTKLNNCVIMDNVEIGENCTVQNSIICDKAVIENNCKLNDCNVGGGYRIATGSRMKSETFSAASH
mmetsp:Transcript_4173/g.6834  ORF Transcript_4173/g.6834 Transcript_4173/m.6834 type:complete len:550 (-) Transcript_4173:78-1727(-)|eukprot:CAMPEP_0174999902 /NCGR_PEP_ID=MMETSP0005-20121125/2301_1 /TAXON_ID=420556 /ORGANISM="Ochromonas sp., Strain CCMP1393" /LENGTH=549 /DNA_ID=CAMNT_0016254659 /DNA_START=1 /DNA_END=1650 /DNA_ORIENTATION=-